MKDRLQPQNIEAEESVLASCMLSQDCLEFTDLLVASDFYKKAHQKIFQVITALVAQKKEVDLLTVTTALNENKQLGEIGGAVYLATLVNDCPVVSNVEHYAQLIKKPAVARKLIITANKILKAAYDGEIKETLEDAQTKILQLSLDSTNTQSFNSIAEITVERVDFYEKISNGDIPSGIKTGFYELDSITGGFQGSKLIIIAARPRIGKTSLLLNMAKNMAKNKHKVGIFSIEMDKEELADRLIASGSGVNLIRLANEGTKLSKTEWSDIQKTAGRIYEYPIIIDDTGGLTIQELKRRAKKMVSEGVEVIFIDQLSKVRGGKGRSEYEQRSFVVNELATLKKELRVPVCLLAQINRKLEDRENKQPGLGDLKSTGSLEEDADIVLLGHRPFEYSHNDEDKNKATWNLAKHRQGATRMINFHWEPKTVTFSSIDSRFV
jgi:replicative DNA helicase